LGLRLGLFNVDNCNFRILFVISGNNDRERERKRERERERVSE
jgi:hypothetical protein